MKRYKYQLGKKTGICPKCGRRRFKFYEETATGNVVGPEFGRCNRQNSCGYHCSPYGKVKEPSRRPLPVTPLLPPSYLRDSMVSKCLQQYQRSPLYDWLLRRWSSSDVSQAMHRLKVGYSEAMGGTTAFFLQDSTGSCRSAKLMKYSPGTGRRVRDDLQGPATAFFHALDKNSDFNYRGCFFGEYNATLNPEATIVVVESEKTALICDLVLHTSGRFGSFVPIATGGCSALAIDPGQINDRFYRGHVLKGRNIILYPDADMVEKWREIAQNNLRPIAASVKVVDVRQEPYCLSESDDIGDWLIRTTSPWRL